LFRESGTRKVAKLGGELGVRRRVRTKFGLGIVNGEMEVERVVWMGTGKGMRTRKPASCRRLAV
jgi:hypothetical protein